MHPQSAPSLSTITRLKLHKLSYKHKSTKTYQEKSLALCATQKWDSIPHHDKMTT